MVKPLSVAVLVLLAAASSGAAQTQSPPLARELTGRLRALQRNWVATVDPADDTRFVAATLLPRQLLVISARYPMPDVLAARIRDRAYRRVFAALRGVGDRAGRVFVQDAGADGLRPLARDAVDTVYEDGLVRLRLDDQPERHGLSTLAYANEVQRLDARYARLLRLLLAHTGRE